MDDFCGSKFWDLNVTWYTEDPDFTECFEKTVLVWSPCAVLWVFAFLEIFYIINSKDKNIPWNFINLSKLFINVFLIVLTTADLLTTLVNSNSVSNVDIVSPLIKIVTFLLSAILTYYNKKYGLRTSGVLFFFWLSLLICGIPQFRREIREVQRGERTLRYPYISYLIYFPLVVIIFFVNCFVDKQPRETKYLASPKPWPEGASSFLSKITFDWFNPLIWKGFRTPIEAADLWDLNPEDMAKEIVPCFDKYWEKSLKKAQGLSEKKDAYAAFNGNSGHVDFVHNTEKKKKKASIYPALVKGFGPTYLLGSILEFCHIILLFVNPQILSLLIAFVNNKEEQWKGYLYVVLLFGSASVRTLLAGQYFTKLWLFGLRIRTALISAIYRKSLRMSSAAKKETTVGEIVNLMAVDCQKFMEVSIILNLVWSAPLQILLALIFLWEIMGPSVLAGLAVMVLLVPVNSYIANMNKRLQVKQMRYKDERVKLMNEILSGIKVLKLYAWELSFEEQIGRIRQKETQVLKKSSYLHAATSFIWSCAPFIVSVVTFTTYLLVDENNVLDAQKAFVSLSLFNILRFPLNLIPVLISTVVQTAVSIKRINRFMNVDELDPDNVHHDPNEKSALLIENGSFDWNEGPVLKNINLRIEKGELTAVVGVVGAGKSSLVSAFLGEMNKTSGRVNTLGKIAYVPQQAWIQNATLRDNILFGRAYEKRKYDKIIAACALKSDLDMLPGGDKTEIGEKGINLSGGQRQRISLARAVYADADIYLLDDPLSAVDSHVGKHIFEKVIGPTGVLKNKTRLLVTHGATYLPEMDKIVVLKDGEVSEIGTYHELLESKGAFADFLTQYVTEAAEEDKPDDELAELQRQFSNTSMSGDLRRRLSRHRSISESETIENQNRRISLQHHESIASLIPPLSEANSELDNLYHRSLSKDSVLSSKSDLVNNKLIETEKAEKGGVKLGVYKHYLKAVGILVSPLILLFNIGSHGFNVGSNFWLSNWSEDTDLLNNSTAYMWKRDMYLGVYGTLGILQGVFLLLSNVVKTIGCIRASILIHKYLLTSVLRWPLNFFDITPLGRILNRFSSDVQTIDVALPMQFEMFLSNAIRVASTLLVISVTTPLFIAIIIPVALLYYLIQKFYIATSRQLKRLESISRSPIYSHFSETVTGVSSIRAYGEQKRFITENEAKVDFNQMCFYPNNIANRWLGIRLEMVGNLIILFASLFAVLGDQNAGLVGLSISYSLQITQSLNFLVRASSDVEMNIVAVERVQEYTEFSQEAAWRIANKSPPASWPENGIVQFKNYSTRYRPGLDLVLKNINVSVEGGEKVGIVGRTGAGKSSLTLALFRIVEAAEGEILMDGLNIATLGLHDLRSRLTIIPQEAILFSGSLRMNLDPFDIHTDEEIWNALEHAHLKSFVKGLPTGLNHEISEGGENLSVGQRQLICLGRALLRKTKILILDEATAAVDLETDDLIQETIRSEFKDCTVLTIAHRLNTIMDSDRIMVLDKGEIAEFDTPANLLNNTQSIFYGMAKDAGLV